MSDDRLGARLREAARDFNLPPETPRERIWERIEAARASRRRAAPGRAAPGPAAPGRSSGHGGRWRQPPRPLFWAAGIAAALAVGIGIGRRSAEHSTAERPGAPALAGAEGVGGAAYRLAALDHLGESEAFLIRFRASLRAEAALRSEPDERRPSSTARQLLATNRLLLDSPAAADPKTRLLLQDLELVLAEIAQLAPRPRAGELELITTGMERSGVLTRLRTAVPAGPGIPIREGAL